MGVSTDGILCYGIPFPDGYRFPWRTEEHGYDTEEWWGNIHGVDNWEQYKELVKTSPLPVECVRHCSDSYPMFILAVPSSYHRAWRGDPKRIEPNALTVDEDARHALIKFCIDHCQPLDDYDELPKLEPAWYLASYWG